jgi:hypothetical protein
LPRTIQVPPRSCGLFAAADHLVKVDLAGLNDVSATI